MLNLTKFTTALLCLFFTACSSNKNNGTPAASSTGLPPVETKQANTNYPPAFEGQTRISGVKTTTPIDSKVINSSLTRPWGIGVLPDGRLLVTEKAGSMRIATTSGQLSEPITGIPPVNAAGQGGLLGVTIDPAFTSNRMIYWTFAESTANGNLTSAAKGTLAADEKRLENVSIIYRATPAYNGTLHYGSRILVDNTGNLLISTGERSDLATRPQAQDLNSALGKIIRITKDGQPAPGNPYIGQANARPEIYSYGHRNVEGMAINPANGEIWISEMGPRGGDELNLIKPGLNYGWPTITYGIEYSGDKINGGKTQQSGMEQPVYYWDPVLSPGGMTFYSSNQIPEWTNNVFIAGLSSKHIARLIINNNKVTGEERLLESEGQRFRDVVEGKDGALYAVTDEGRLYRIAKRN